MTITPVSPAAGEDRPLSLRERELAIAREVAHAFLSNTLPLEIYRRALATVTPLVGATFSSVFLRDPDDATLLKLECAQNWPQSSAKYLGQLRIRVGRGPTGRAVADGGAVEVPDVFADPSMREWWEPARELGFRSMISLPLGEGPDVGGAVSFYFVTAREFTAEDRRVLSLVAEQLAVIVKRTQVAEELRHANEKLRRQNQELAVRVREAEEARRLKEEFLANMSHELRTPLTSILGYTYLLGTGQAGKVSKEQQAGLERIDKAATVLLRLITDLIELSQLKLGRSTLDLATHDAADLARQAVEVAGEPQAAVTFQLAVPEQPISIRTDGEKVVKVIENLLSNAFKFTADGTVTLAIAEKPGDGGTIEWSVRDTGMGIRAEDRESIFDEFRQVDGSSTRLYGGTGLGLALSLRLARLLGGDLEVQSEPGSGSIFRFHLPKS